MKSDISIITHIQGLRGSMKPALQQVADSILANPEAARSKKLNELATACGVSEASISRFVRGIGLANFRDFQLRLASEVIAGSSSRGNEADHGQIYENIGRQDDAVSILNKVVHRTADVARDCLSTISSDAMEQAARMVRAADVVYLFAAGLSALAAESAVLRFARIGKPVVFHRDRNNQLLMSAALKGNVLAIGISDSGRTSQTVTALAAARQSGAATIAMTAFPESPLTRQADLTILTPAGYAPSGEEPIYESMVSKFGQLIAIDALYSLVAVRDFDASAASVEHGNAIIRQSRSMRQQNEQE
ncbi:MurR/RpiR family transcriptional regulator [Paracoccus albus]|uniref:MurR/RpiR family transcriptional regulator n=1 Tax=Paracoccus albus TaxID=3017784 RepID=UPI0022F0389C|nr:MurR/RpiR family transcriptional regulator [Paracoccus albus]WBU61602.1 MurR/RpiR family transcriptional regulator [Paracoccus albus]